MARVTKSALYADHPLLNAVTALQPVLLDWMRAAVEIESPSDDKSAVDRCGEAVAALAAGVGGRVKRHRKPSSGDVLELRFTPVSRPAQIAEPVMLLGHIDTVWPMGTLRKMPFRIADGRVWGPGTLDMKAGVVMGLVAIRALREADALSRPVIFLLSSDEEVGSTVSRPIIE